MKYELLHLKQFFPKLGTQSGDPLVKVYLPDNLTEMGWLVLRFWETDIKKDLEGCVSEVMKYIPITNDSNHP